MIEVGALGGGRSKDPAENMAVYTGRAPRHFQQARARVKLNRGCSSFPRGTRALIPPSPARARNHWRQLVKRVKDA